ncbi:MAG: hypothetical protein HY273_06980 [Gammaproteobacteria bacterium]|nr:hypothetical protein [Gammaproteobacteria bacterium]
MTNFDAHQLNQQCDCQTLDTSALQHELSVRLPATLLGDLHNSHPHLFSATPVFVDALDLARMQAAIAAIERVVAMPAYVQQVLAGAPELARFDPGNTSVFFGYDFHLTPQGPQLIEVNTNAGGAMLYALLANSQLPCDTRMQGMSTGPLAPAALEPAFVDMFIHEWRSVRGDAPLHCIAIVDDAPMQQYLYPEFVLFRELFSRHEIRTLIVDPRELVCRDGGLYGGTQRVDLVYNRLTDFALSSELSACLRAAYAEGIVVFTPHPRAHALYADKRNLCVWSDAAALRALGVDEATVQTLTMSIPRTLQVDAANAATLWSERRRWFFKPAAGYGGKAAYRGDKITKRVWEEVVAGGYIAQRTVPPSERCVHAAGVDTLLKVDLRNYVYRGAVQCVAARLYQGQTTNFRTPGGGFAPVYSPA